MITFKEYLIEMAKKKKKQKEPSAANLSRGHEFGMAGAGKSGAMLSKKQKSKTSKKQRSDWKKQSKDYY